MRYLLLVLAIPLFVACVLVSRPATAVPASASNLTWQKKLDAPARVEVHNMNGALKAEASANDTLSVIATLQGDASEVAKVHVTVHEDGGTIFVCALWPGQSTCAGPTTEQARVKVEITLKVPAKVDHFEGVTMNGEIALHGVAAATRLQTMNGAITVEDAGGAVDATTMNGPVTARLLARSAPVKLSTKNGKLELALPSNADADVDATTTNGSVMSSFGEGSQHGHGPLRSHFRLGAGGAHVALDTLNGSIVVKAS